MSSFAPKMVSALELVSAQEDIQCQTTNVGGSLTKRYTFQNVPACERYCNRFCGKNGLYGNDELDGRGKCNGKLCQCCVPDPLYELARIDLDDLAP
ncbi:hypothetical protein C5167_014765 [Papaver somniferum]|uniref:Uncharacterized protein n=2 Tax=Papaver somniferum TaxID=3469 RepID=A0A4Y7J444_PAPSO|nr:hypothetical protein C5167_014765 [Papaver somniferum]